MKWREVEELDLSTRGPKSTAMIGRGDGATGCHFPSLTNMQECSGNPILFPEPEKKIQNVCQQ